MGTRERLAAHLPVFALEIRTPRLTLRYPDDDDVVALAELGAAGVHAEDAMPFSIPWSVVPAPFQQRNTLAYLWSQRPTLQRDDWNIPLVVLRDDEPIGTQGLFGVNWAAVRAFETGSWLGRAFQGHGFGKEMRQAVLQLGFAGFGAEEARTFAYGDNPASLGVTRALGYRPNGVDRVDRGGKVAEMHRFTMARTDWEATRRDDIDIVGAEAVLALFGTELVPGAPAPGPDMTES